MPAMKRDAYIKKYVGSQNKRRTKVFLRNGKKVSKSLTTRVKYTGLRGIYNGSDLSGFIMNNKVYNVKNTRDSSRKSAQKWEAKSFLSALGF